MMKTNKFILLALLILTTVLLIGCAAEKTPYEINNAENFTVSVKYDANGGEFTTNTYSIVDSYSADKEEIALLAPDDAARGNDAFAPIKNGYFLGGWYSEREEISEGQYSYSGKWDFENDRLTVDPAKEYDANEPVLTLYAAWVPLFEVQFYNLEDGELIDSYAFDPRQGTELSLPHWSEETGAVEMFKFPEVEDHTFKAVYLDKEGKEAVEGETLLHTGSVNEETGLAKDHVMKLYIELTEGEWYHIYNVEQFLDNASVNGSYEIMADLDFKDEIWPTSFMYGNFGGTIKGNGHTIKNVSLEQTNASKANAGLFGNLTEEARLENITFENVSFTVKAGTRMAGTSYGILCGAVADNAQLEKVAVKNSTMLVDSGCYFGTDDYTLGLVCGMGDPKKAESSGLSCVAAGDNPEKVKITVNGNQVELEFVA